MKTLNFILFFLFIAALNASAQSCLNRAVYMGLPDEDPEIFDEFTYFNLNDLQLVINNDTIIYESFGIEAYYGNEALEDLIQCEFTNREDFHDVNGIVKSYGLEYEINGYVVNSLQFIQFMDYDRSFHFLIVNHQYEYELINTLQYDLDTRHYYKRFEIEKSTINYVLEDDITGSLIIIDTPKYEIVSELVLLSQGYDSLIVQDPVFSEEWIYFDHEISDCDDAIFEDYTENYIFRDRHSIIEIEPPILETVTEQILSTSEYEGTGYYERNPILVDTLVSSFNYDFNIRSSDPACRDLQYLSCVEFDLHIDTMLTFYQLGEVFPACKSGYYPAGKYCYSDEAITPATYVTRSYERLIVPSKAIPELIDNEFKTYNRTIISNKNELDDSCIIYVRDSVKVFRLVQPSSTIVKTIPSSYDTHYYKIIHEGPDLEISKSEENVNTIEILDHFKYELVQGTTQLPQYNVNCLHDLIKERLVQLNRLSVHDDAFSNAYYEAILQYQIEFQLPVGIIERELINHLKILI